MLTACSNKASTLYSYEIQPMDFEDFHYSTDVLTMDIALEKNRYFKDEDINLIVRLTNVSGEPITINSQLRFESLTAPLVRQTFTIEVRDEMGRVILPGGSKLNYPPLNEHHFIQILPGESIEEQSNLANLFYLEPGVYYLQGRYINLRDSPDGRIAWKGEIRTSSIKLEVTE
jgi:hypothetical protein